MEPDRVGECWEEIGLDAAALSLELDGTIVDPRREEAERVGVEGLPRLLGDGAHLELGEVLGTGGMGVVRGARQAGLEREVAVKQVRAGVAPAGAALLREARAAGAVAHPNVVPVHLLGVDEDGQPVMVMKRVGGRSWHDVLGEPGRAVGDVGDLERQLRVLVQVTHAIEYSHDRGVLHRDLKPANVLLGRFGEVYVVDWGLAVSLKDDGVPGLPLAREATRIVGTPSYMSPEQAGGLGHLFGPATDVYQLGAVLYEVLAGEPLRSGLAPRAALAAAFVGEGLEWPEGVPRGLQRICARAMARDPEQRYPTAGAFRAALERWLRQAGTARLLAEADSRRARLVELVAAGGEAEEIRTAFDECRFAYGLVLRERPGDEDAEDGLQLAVGTLARHMLARGDARVAEVLVGMLPRADEELAAAVEAALEGGRAAESRLAELEHQRDTTVGARLRSRVLGGVAGAWVVANLAAGWLTRSGTATVAHLEYAGMLGVVLVALIVIEQRWRETLFEHEVNRRVVVTTMVMVAHDVAIFLVAYLLDVEMLPAMIFMGLVSIAAWGLLGVMVEPLMAVAGLAMAAVLPLFYLWPAWMFEWMALASVVGHGGVALGWLRRATPRRP